MTPIPPDKKETLDQIVDDLKSVDNIIAIVLGGSYCTGFANKNSDLDIGIYYHESAPFDIEKIKLVARRHSVDETLTVTDLYQWGKWVNGGAWINTGSGEVDFVYRNIEQVKSVIEKSKNGYWENDFDQQPPYGFSSVIYLAETKYCRSLFDPDHVIDQLKDEVREYPVKLRQTIIQQSLWSAEFTIWQADKFARKEDIYNASGCFTRALKNIMDALFALNKEYPMGDKNSIEIINQFAKSPIKLREQVGDILNMESHTLSTNAKKLRNLFDLVVSLAGGMYKPYFIL